MANLQIRLTPTDKNHATIDGSINVTRADELPGRLNAGGYLKVTRDDDEVQWVNLANILKVEQVPEDEPSVQVF